MKRATSIMLIAAAACTGDADDFALGQVEGRLDIGGSLALGRAYVGDVLVREISVRSTGTGIGRVEQITARGIDLTVTYDDRAARGIEPGSMLRISVTWKPTVPGALPENAGVTVRGEGESFWIPASGDALAIPDCDDRNPCTDDTFNRALARCTNTALPPIGDVPCDDGNACTDADRCVAGRCIGTAASCDDGNPCTVDLCDPISGCVTLADPSYCEDGNPCTVGSCNATGDCDFNPAPDGTQCGDFDCATTHVCFGGVCAAIDVSGATDGVPCNDGEACTGDDRCFGGVCTPGTLRGGAPEIIANFETFGGTNSWVTTDGYRYLFADRDALRLAVESTLGVVGAGLSQRARIDLVAAIAPVAWAPGHFIVATPDALHMIDATNIDTPVIAWSEPSQIGPYSLVARADGGLVIHAQYVSSGGPHFQPLVSVTDASGPGDEAMVPLAMVPSQPFGPPIRLGESVVFDLDADGPNIVWSDGSSVHFVVIGPTGEILERQYYSGDPDADGMMFTKVSVSGRRVAALAGNVIEMIDFELPQVPTCVDDAPTATCQPYVPAYRMPTVPEPGEYLPCGGVVETNCMPDTTCEWVWVACAGDDIGCVEQTGLCMPTAPSYPTNPIEPTGWLQAPEGTRDILLGETFVYYATDQGVFMSPPYLVQMMPTLVDPMPAMRIDRDLNKQHLLLHGGIALPLRSNSGWMGMMIDISGFTRVTGPLHGNLVAMVPNGDEVILAGPVAIARFDTTSLSFTEWNLTEGSATGDRARAIKSSEGTSLVQTNNDYYYAMYGWPEECVGPVLDVHEAANVTQKTSQVLCGMFSGSFDIAGDWVWAYTSDRPDIMDSMPLGRIRAWQLGGGPEALIDLPANEYYDYWAPTATRAADDGASIAMLSVPTTDIEPWGLEARVFPADPGQAASAITTWLPGAWWSYGQPLRDIVALEGDLFLYGREGEVALHTSLVSADPIWVSPLTVTLDNADLSVPPTVPYMRNGRAWVAWDQIGPIPVDAGPIIFHRLTQVSYSLGQLDDEGGVTLEQPPLRVLDNAGSTLVTTEGGVVIIQPACL